MTALFPIELDDLNVLGRLLVRELQELMPFSHGRVYPVTVHENGLPPVSLSERQRQRAQQAMESGEPFWDRVSYQVLIPLNNGSRSIGTLVLSGVSRAVGPEEALRWLPLLQTCANQTLAVLKQKTFLAPPGQMPQYLRESLERHNPGRDEPCYWLHLLFRAPVDPDAIMPVVSGLCERLFPRARPRFLGMSSREVWVDLGLLPPHTVAKGLKGIVPVARKKKMGLSKAFLHRIDYAGSEEAFSRITQMEDAAARLRASVMGTADLVALEERLGVRNLSEVLSRVHKVSKETGGREMTVVFACPVGIPSVLSPDDTSALKIVPAGDEAAFFLVSRAGRPADALKIVTDLCPGIPAKCTMGAASNREPTTRGRKAVVASLWAFLHARLLGSGSRVAFDPLSWNVAGDELVSWGDIPGAVHAYRQGLRMDSSDANLWNSLGVCLGQLGRKKEAQEAFERAVSLKADHYMAHYNLGGVYEARGRTRAAVKSFQKALELCPDDLTIATRLAQALLKTGRSKEAVGVLEPLVHGSKVSIGAPLRILAQALRATGDWAGAKACLQQAVKINPSDQRALALLAQGYWEEEEDRDTGQRLAATVLNFGKVDREAARLLKGLFGRKKQR